MSLVQFWLITGVIAGGSAGVAMLLLTPKTEAPPPIPAPVENNSRRQAGSALGLLAYNSPDRYDTDGTERCISSVCGPMRRVETKMNGDSDS